MTEKSKLKKRFKKIYVVVKSFVSKHVIKLILPGVALIGIIAILFFIFTEYDDELKRDFNILFSLEIVGIIVFVSLLLSSIFSFGKLKKIKIPVLLSWVAVVGVTLLNYVYYAITGAGEPRYGIGFVASVTATVGGVFALYYSYAKKENEEKKLDHEKIALFNSRFVDASKLLAEDSLSQKLSGIHAFVALADDWLSSGIETYDYRKTQAQAIIDILCETMRSASVTKNDEVNDYFNSLNSISKLSEENNNLSEGIKEFDSIINSSNDDQKIDKAKKSIEECDIKHKDIENKLENNNIIKNIFDLENLKKLDEYRIQKTIVEAIVKRLKVPSNFIDSKEYLEVKRNSDEEDITDVEIYSEYIEGIEDKNYDNQYIRWHNIDFDFSNITFYCEIDFSKTIIINSLNFKKSIFISDAYFYGAIFEGDALFEGAKFVSEAWFEGAKFVGEAWFEGAKFVGEAWFGSIKFTGDALFDSANFDGKARFNHAKFTRIASFEGAKFVDNTSFYGANFDFNAWFKNANFERDAGFECANFDNVAWFDEAKFKRHAKFDIADFKGDTMFADVKFDGNAGFNGATFKNATMFNGANFKGNTWFNGVTFMKLTDLSSVILEEDAHIIFDKNVENFIPPLTSDNKIVGKEPKSPEWYYDPNKHYISGDVYP